jgi:hypothetical protein
LRWNWYVGDGLPSGHLTWPLKMAIEIVDEPLKLVIIHSYMMLCGFSRG